MNRVKTHLLSFSFVYSLFMRPRFNGARPKVRMLIMKA